MRVLYLDVEHTDCKVVDIPDDLEVFYSMLNCRVVEMPMRKIGPLDRYFNIICDEEGALKNNPLPSAVSNSGQVMLLGNLIITNVNEEEGTLESLSIEDCEYLVNFIQPACLENKRTGEVIPHLILTECEF